MTARRYRAAWVVGLACASIPLRLGRGPSALATSLPPGFQESTVATGLEEPAVLAFSPDGRLFIGEKAAGKIRVVPSGSVNGTSNVAALPIFLDITQVVPSGSEFDSFYERGLLGIAFDPAFATNGFVYVYHTLCKQPQNGGCSPGGSSKNRIIRVHAAGDTADDTAPVLILDDIDSDAGNHNGGWIAFGPTDGKLYVSTGDGGSDHQKSQRLDSLSGKILRLEADGSVPDDNPFAGSSTARGEVWAWGLRNPWRCRFRGDGRLLCGDVGEDTWEEIDVIFRDNDYGWPDTEGPFTLVDHPTFTPPIHSYLHNFTNAAIMGGDFGANTNFPGDYAASYFFGDYARGIIQRVVLDATGTAVEGSASDFATGIGRNSVTDVVAGPDGALYYTRYNFGGSGEVRRIFLAAGNHAPEAAAQAIPSSGDVPLSVQFSSIGSIDEDGDALTFTWDFGDGFSGSGPSPTHEYQVRGEYTATLAVSDGKPSPGPGVATVPITAGHPPLVTITQPVDGTVFTAGEQFALTGGATDVEDGQLASSQLTWKIVFHHADHTHPFIDHLFGATESFTTANVGETDADVGYEIILTAVDSDGMTASASVFLAPALVDLTLKTSPAGLAVTLDGQPRTTPFTVTSVVGMQRTLGAPDAPGFAFASWSDGGDRTHAVTAPTSATAYMATYDAVPIATASTTSTPTPVTTPTPLGLTDPLAARAADVCQRAITRVSLGLVRATLRQLGRCSNGIQTCVQKQPGNDPCLAKAKAGCARALDAIHSASATMRAAVQRQCPSLTDLRTALGLGFDTLAVACAVGTPDVDALATCIATRHRCSAERLFAMAMPRIGALLQLAGVTDPATSCLGDPDGDVAHVPAGEAKPVLKCMDAIGKAAAGFAAARTKSLTGCAGTLFTCVQRKPPADVHACLANSNASCARAFASAASDGAKLRAAIDGRCAQTVVSYDVLRSTAAAHLDQAAADCVRHGVADLGSLAAYEDCLTRQHGCLAAEIVGTTVPRSTELLTLLGRTLIPDDCPADPTPVPTPQ